MWDKINELYNLYGFRIEDDDDWHVVYTYEQGYFNNAEIIIKDIAKKGKIEKLRDEYSRSGYSVSVKEITTYEELKENLFNGFFRTKGSKGRVKEEYREYIENQKKRLGGIDYTYITSKYTVDGKMHDDDNILDVIYKCLDDEKRNLVILEAPAGFGKTCTAYEVSKMLADDESQRIPMMAELSKNRRASIFRYVLLSEINAKFNLSYPLVEKQIKNGKIPLIIDGFDELLSRNPKGEENTDDAITMLDTISELLREDSNASILLTSRKSSIFCGDIFDAWVESNIKDCKLTRIQILTPTIQDWLDKDKRSFFDERMINLKNVLNPVLLSMLKNKPIEEYDRDFKCESDVLEVYIRLMFERERKRQLLLIDATEQRHIMKKLSAVMVQLDVSSVEVEEMKTLIETAIENDVDKYMSYYQEQEQFDADRVAKVTQDDFLLKLVNNAMLDRVKPNTNDIGFINEFIFGIFIGEAIIDGYLKLSDVSNGYLNMAVSSFSSENEQRKECLLEIISQTRLNLSTEQKLMIGFNLKGEILHDFVDEYISNMIFDETIQLNNEKFFYNCIFDGCTFSGCMLKTNMFEGCHFINCCFYNVIVNVVGRNEEESFFVSCLGHEMLQKSIRDSLSMTQMIDDDKEEINYKKLVLEQYWMPGSERPEMRKSYRTLFKGIDSKYRKEIAKAIEELKKEGFLFELMHCLELNKKKLSDVENLLNREVHG